MSDSITASVSAIGARAIAEYASSVRRTPQEQEERPLPTVLDTRFDAAKDDWVTTEMEGFDPCSSASHVATPVTTMYIQPARARVEAVSIRPVGGGDVDLMRYDAVFWTESAVEKFLLSYYASKYQWAAALYLTTLTRVFYGYLPNVAAGNRPKGAPGTLVYTAEDGSVTEHEAIPFAIGHLPRSDYAPLEAETGAMPLGFDFWFLFRDANGEGVIHRPVAHFLEEPR
jgi:hypothetical protein